MQPHRRWYLTVGVAALIAAGIAVRRAESYPSVDEAPILALLTALVAIGVMFPIDVRPRVKVAVGATAMYAALLLYGVVPALIVTVIGAGIAFLLRPRNSVASSLFNVAVLALSVCLAGWTIEAISHLVTPVAATDALALVAIVAGGVVMYVANTVLVAVSTDLQLRQPILHYYLHDQKEKALQNLALFGLGALAALVGQDRPWAIALIIVPMGIVALSFQQTTRIRHQTREALEQLADIVDLRDPYTAEHSRRVATLVASLCKELGVNRTQADIIVRAARVHDIGKLGVSSGIVTEPRPLTELEVLEMRRHPEIGATILSRFVDFRAGVDMVLHHHERWDGTGYPTGLAKEAIPLGARIIAVCDSFDAITSDRPYRLGASVHVALAELARHRGTQFDPQIVDAFLRIHGYALEPVAGLRSVAERG